MIIKTASLPEDILHIVKEKGTEPAFSGEYNAIAQQGSYLCRQCGLALFRANDQFHSSCGWPSFDGEIAENVKMEIDADRVRTEILCARCYAHLGHIFKGEGLTHKNTRYCVNALSIEFVKDTLVKDTDEAIFAAGCFWGVEYYFSKLPGVLKVEVGYTGGSQTHPDYETVCQGHTGHYEAVRVVYDIEKLNYASVVKFFFEIHDPTQTNGQGPDVGEQYLSAIFYYNQNQKAICLALIDELTKRGFKVSTKVLPVQVFWKAENYHQQYYAKNGKQPYCHRYQKKFF